MSNEVKPIAIPQPEHRFNSLSEIINDNSFRYFLKQNIHQLHSDRHSRPAPKPGFYYKRDWYDRMMALGQIHAPFFLNNIEDIWNKQSSLSSETRSVIKEICEKSLQQTLQHYSNQLKDNK